MLSLAGMIKDYSLFFKLENAILKKNEVIEITKAGATDAQDDFRNSKYDVVKEHSADNLIKDLYAKREELSKTERQMLIGNYKRRIDGETLSVKPYKDVFNYNYMKNIFRVRSKNTERIYYYSHNGIYHSDYYCSNLSGDMGKIKIYSSMEECALSGSFPCVKCILGLDG